VDRLTLGKAKETLWRQISHDGPEHPRVSQCINECCQRFFRNQKFANVIHRINLTVYDNMVTLPREVSTLIAASDSCRDYPVRSSWFEFSPSGFSVNTSDLSSNSMNIIDYGSEWSTFRDLPSTGAPLRIGFSKYEQAFTVIVQGEDADGNVIYSDGDSRINGVEYTFGGEPEPGDPEWFIDDFPAIGFAKITKVIKPVTMEPVKLYYIDAAPVEIASYAPGEEVPGYRRYRLPSSFDDGDTIVGLVRRGYVPAVADNDVLYPGDITCLRTMVHAWNKSEAGDFATAAQLRAVAYNDLDRAYAEYIGPQTSQIPMLDFGNNDLVM
jgi:hypothetical protein